MANPLQFTDLFGKRHTEPSVTGLIEVQRTEPARVDLVNDLIILSTFRSGKPQTLHTPPDLSSLANLHDPNRDGDQGVALARVAKSGFGDRDVFGAAQIRTVRVDPATNAKCNIKGSAGAVNLIEVARTDYGSHTNGPGLTIVAASTAGKKITLTDGIRSPMIKDNLGVLLSVQYTGDATTATLAVLHAIGKITYTGQPADADIVTVNGVAFEFDDGGGVAGGSVAVLIGADEDATFANLAAAIAANVDNVSAVQSASTNTVTVTGTEAGVVLAETLDSGGVFAVAHVHPAARLQIILAGDQTDGSQDLDVALSLSQFKSIDALATYISKQLGYTATVNANANKFIDSVGLDPASGVNAKAAAVDLTGYNAAIIDFINNGTRGFYSATELVRDEPDDDQTQIFAGGTTPAATATDWENALNVVAAGLELGGIVLLDTDDPAIFSMLTTFISEQRTNGKWFRGYVGAEPAQTVSAYSTIAAALDHERMRMTVQRLGVFQQQTRTIEYLHPVYFAAALAGGASGNRPYESPLTNKRLRFAGLHTDDDFDVTVRAQLLESGITVAKREEERLVVTLAVTTSRDPELRMLRIASEIDTVDLIDSAVRSAFLFFRGRWAARNIDARVRGTMTKVLNQFVVGGAISAGKDAEGNDVPAWQFTDPAYVIEAGVLRVNYQIRIPGELNHISLHGRAEYVALVGEVSGGLRELSVAIPIAA